MPFDKKTALDSLVGDFDVVLATVRMMPHCDTDPHLTGTAERLARAIVNDYFSGLWEDPDEIFNRGIWRPVNDQADQMILEKDIDFTSFCAHHWAPFVGHVHAAYIPNEKMVGLSKIPRVVEVYSRRPQVQERLTEQLADCLIKNLQPKGVGIVIDAEHQCMACRGVKKQGTITRTTALRGCFKRPSVKWELLTAIDGRR